MMDPISAHRALKESRLYGILDLGYLEESQLAAACSDLLAGGVDILQLRAKGHTSVDVERMAKSVVSLCADAEVPFIINDFPEVAVSVNADGVHVGQDDGSLQNAREIVGANKIIGRSTHSYEQAIEAKEEGFDYIGFGPLFPTPTKKGRPGIGLDQISQVNRQLADSIPMFCIGGITRENLNVVTAAGAERVVIVSDLLKSVSISKATRSVVDQISR